MTFIAFVIAFVVISYQLDKIRWWFMERDAETQEKLNKIMAALNTL